MAHNNIYKLRILIFLARRNKGFASRKFLTATFFVAYFSFYSTSLSAQTLRYGLTMPYVSGSAYSVKQSDPLSFTGNQAALAQLQTAGAGIYTERRFMLSENTIYCVTAAFKSSLGNFGIQGNYSGFINFNDHKIGLAYGRSLGTKLDLGVEFNYSGYSIPGYASGSALNFEIGAILHLTEKLNAGLQVYNPVSGKPGKFNDEKLASAYKFGLGYDASDNFYVTTELVKEENKNINVIGSIQYHLSKVFFAKAGFQSDTGSGFAGFGVGWKNLRLDLTGNYHPQLGFSPGLLLIVNFKEQP